MSGKDTKLNNVVQKHDTRHNLRRLCVAQRLPYP